MSFRRSARLSGAASVTGEDTAQPNGALVPKVANIGKKRKNAADAGPPETLTNDARPSTPKKKRAKKAAIPATPTPAAIGLMSIPYSSGDIDDSTTPVNRLAVPNGTNAPLVTPETHRLIANKLVDQVSPSKSATIKTTTANILEEAIAHLIRVEPKLQPVIEKHPCHIFSPEGLSEEIDPFSSLSSGIISQQVCAIHHMRCSSISTY